MSKRVVVVGSINLDLVATAEKIPVAGETVIGSNFKMFPGGKGANQAVAAARLDADVYMIGKLGRDSFGETLRTSLLSAGVNTDSVDSIDNSSGVALIVTDADGDNLITVVPGANGEVRPEDIAANARLISTSGIVLSQLEIPLDAVESLAQICVEHLVPFVLDPAPARPLPQSLLEKVTYLTPNETETCSLLGWKLKELSDVDLELAASSLLGRGCKNVLLKLGARGSYLALADGTRKRLLGYKVSPVDSTAAGDAFNAAFAVALLNRKHPISAAEWASAVAAVSVTRAGAQPSMPTSSEVESFLEERQALAPQL
jgi:ribokinase